LTLEDLGNLGDFIGAIGVVASLVYLALQIRQNTESVRAATEIDACRAWNEWDSLFAHDEQLVLLWQRGAADLHSLNPGEIGRFNSTLVLLFHIAEMFYRQNQRGLLDEELWRGWEEHLAKYLRLPGVQEWLRNLRPLDLFSRSFREYVETKLQHMKQVDRSSSRDSAA
jgi:hypothetical protein